MKPTQERVIHIIKLQDATISDRLVSVVVTNVHACYQLGGAG